MTDTVNTWLGKCYKAEHMGGSLPQTLEGFRTWLTDDPANRAAAVTRLAGMSDQIAKRDFIMRKNMSYLSAALAATPQGGN